MRTITYKCDVCREEIKDLSQLKTIFYDSVKRSYMLIQVGIQEYYDKQVCHGCIKMFKEAEIK